MHVSRAVQRGDHGPSASGRALRRRSPRAHGGWEGRCRCSSSDRGVRLFPRGHFRAPRRGFEPTTHRRDAVQQAVQSFAQRLHRVRARAGDGRRGRGRRPVRQTQPRGPRRFENVSKSGAKDSRAREAGEINKSLLTLGRVITALVDRLGHVPYRDSKLTRLLRDALGGKSKACVVATVSPAASAVDETISTLEYARRAASIKCRPEVNARVTKTGKIRELSAELDRLRADYARRGKRTACTCRGRPTTPIARRERLKRERSSSSNPGLNSRGASSRRRLLCSRRPNAPTPRSSARRRRDDPRRRTPRVASKTSRRRWRRNRTRRTRRRTSWTSSRRRKRVSGSRLVDSRNTSTRRSARWRRSSAKSRDARIRARRRVDASRTRDAPPRRRSKG